MDFTEKTILITGATRGLGAKLTHLFWQAGANLLLVARHAELLTALREQLITTRSNQTITIFPVDLADAQQVEKLTRNLQSMHLDILINNAAIQGPIGSVWENDWQAWQTTLQVNLLTPIALSRAVIPSMLRQKKGKIINLSGGGATQARPQYSAYAVAKAGLVRFSETLAEEVKEQQIDVNCVAPGTMKTAMTETQSIQNDSSEQAAKLCLFLASVKSDGITGKLISAVWDPWENFAEYAQEIQTSDVYTLRRIVPSDRGIQI